MSVILKLQKYKLTNRQKNRLRQIITAVILFAASFIAGGFEKLQNIKSHESYFSSFTELAKPCPELKRHYSSEDAFCYEVLELAREYNGGFIYIFSNGRIRPTVKHSENAPFVYVKEMPTLAIDLFEHSYFLDYGFEREKYLRAAIGHLNLTLLFQ